MSPVPAAVAVLLAVLCGGVASPAAAERLRFGHLTSDDGLSRNWVHTILEDSRGFLWVGTQNGLNRYDGHGFTVFRHVEGDPSSLPSSVIGTLFEDSRGRLWVGTGWGRGGVAVYDRHRDRFQRLPIEPGPGGLSGDWVHAILEDRNGSIWVGTENGLDRVDLDAGRYDHYPLDLPHGDEDLESVIFSLHEDRRGRIWAGSRSGLVEFDPATGRHERWKGRKDHPGGPESSPVWDLEEAEGGGIWVAAFGGGLYLVDPESGHQERYIPRKDDPTSLCHTRVRRLARDQRGRLWVGTENGGLCVLDPDTGRFTRHLPDLKDELSLNSASVWALFVDDQDIAWVGTYNGGLNYTSHQTFDVIRARSGGLSDPHVTAIMEDRRGDLWIGTDGGGLNRLDRDTGRFTHYYHDPDDPGTIGADAVFGLIEDRRGGIWVGAWDGALSRLDPRTGQAKRYRHDPDDPTSIVSDNVWKLVELESGEMLVATPDGVDLLDPGQGVFRRLASLYPEVGQFQTASAAVGPDGDIWLGRRMQGVQHVDPSSGRVTDYRHDPTDPDSPGPGWVSSIHIDRHGNVWFGTEGGLGCLPRGAERTRRYTTADGLPDDYVQSILEDAAGNLWLGTPQGLSRFVDAVRLPEDPEFDNFDVHDGLQGQEFATDAALRSSWGLLYFGGEDGLSVLDPEDIRRNHDPPRVVLTDLRIFNESVVPGAPGSPLTRSITETHELTLSPDQSVVTFEFAALNFRVPQKNQYAYRLEGVDRDWNQAGTQNTATYAHLPPGSHVFRVRASNNDGVWNEEGISLRLRVRPRWYERRGVVTLAFAALALAAFAGYLWRVRQLEARERELAHRVDERTRDLHRAKEELEERVAARTSELAGEKERLAVTLRSIGDGVIATDVEGRIVLMNRLAEQLTGWTRSEAEGRSLDEVFQVIDESTRRPPPDPVVAVVGRQARWTLPAHSILKRRDGSELQVSDSVAAIRDDESRIVGVVLVFRDVTERRKVEEQLQNAQKLEALGVLAGGIAHDFNNLLMGIFGYMGVAQRRRGDPEATQDALSRALAVLEKARGLTGQLLTFSRAGQPVTAPLALDRLLRNCVEFTLSGSNVQCDLDLADDLWPCEGNEQQIGQVVDNLVLNARQAMPEGGRMTLSASNVSVPTDVAAPLADGRYVRVELRDSGGGIPPELLPRVFEPFFTTKSTGSGLGLATAYSIVTRHGGRLEVASEAGSGSCFTFYLPASSRPVVDAPEDDASAAPGQGRILVLDDEDYIRDVVREALEEFGYRVEAVAGGEEAVEAFRAARETGDPFNLVILDLTIPGGMGGLDALALLRELDPAVRAIASSGYSGDPIMAHPAEHGFAAGLAKPYTVGDLGEVVTRVLGRESS